MSALTDLFTALANKIRSKTGEATTYTPLQMVSDGIDDVYQAGVDAGETTHTRTYTPAANTAANDMGVTHDYRYVNTSGMIVPSGAKSITANGTGIDVSSYATANVNVPNPTLSGNATAADVANGKTFYNSTYTKQTGSYVAPTINSITPSDSTPVALETTKNYNPSTTGYAVKNSPTQITQNELNAGVYFTSGLKNMPSSGYAYSSQPMSETVLWTNPTTTSSGTWAAQTINLSQSIENFSYIGIFWTRYWDNGDADAKTATTIHKVSDIKKLTGASGTMEGVIGAYHATNNYVRTFIYASNTSLTFRAACRVNYNSSDNKACVPLKVIGYK